MKSVSYNPQGIICIYGVRFQEYMNISIAWFYTLLFRQWEIPQALQSEIIFMLCNFFSVNTVFGDSYHKLSVDEGVPPSSIGTMDYGLWTAFWKIWYDLLICSSNHIPQYSLPTFFLLERVCQSLLCLEELTDSFSYLFGGTTCI